MSGDVYDIAEARQGCRDRHPTALVERERTSRGLRARVAAWSVAALVIAPTGDRLVAVAVVAAAVAIMWWAS